MNVFKGQQAGSEIRNKKRKPLTNLLQGRESFGYEDSKIIIKEIHLELALLKKPFLKGKGVELLKFNNYEIAIRAKAHTKR